MRQQEKIENSRLHNRNIRHLCFCVLPSWSPCGREPRLVHPRGLCQHCPPLCLLASWKNHDSSWPIRLASWLLTPTAPRGTCRISPLGQRVYPSSGTMNWRGHGSWGYQNPLTREWSQHTGTATYMCRPNVAKGRPTQGVSVTRSDKFPIFG